MSVSNAVPRKFRDDFMLVSTHYGFGPGTEEHDLAKRVALDNLPRAIRCFSVTADKLRREFASREVA